jgi:hypothetical protein
LDFYAQLGKVLKEKVDSIEQTIKLNMSPSSSQDLDQYKSETRAMRNKLLRPPIWHPRSDNIIIDVLLLKNQSKV